MSWTTIHTFAYQEVPTAANVNIFGTNLQETMPAKVTTKGDMASATGANAIARVAAPSAQYWSPIYDSAQAGGVRYAPQPLLLSNGYSSYTVVNTVTKTDTWSYTLPANTLPSKGVIEIICQMLFKNNSGSTYNVSNEFTFGSSTLTVVSVNVTSGTAEMYYRLHVFIRALNATNSQRLIGTLDSLGQSAVSTAVAAYVSYDQKTTSEDTTASKTIKLAVTLGAAHANLQQVTYDPIILLHPSMT